MATSLFAPSTPPALRPSSGGGGDRMLSLSGGRLHLPLPLSTLSGRRAVATELRLQQSPAGRLSVRCGAVTTIVQSEFSAEVLASELPVLVEFVAEWCGPCRLISPVIEWASQEYDGKLKVVKLDHDANPQLIEEYKVYGLPALILFKNGEEVPESRREGAITKVKLKEYLDSLLGSTTAV